MPVRPRRPCRKPGCPALTADGWCEQHRKDRPASAKPWGSITGSAHSRGYGATWRKLRRLILARDPLCAVCGREASTEVDHVVPKSQGGTDSDENLRGVCGPCHAAKTREEGRRARALRPPGFPGSLPS